MAIPYHGKIAEYASFKSQHWESRLFSFFRKFFLSCQISRLVKHNIRILHNRARKPADM